jgi:hypothetical protein
LGKREFAEKSYPNSRFSVLCYNKPMMDGKQSGDSPSIALHKRQFTWQILVPFLVMAALIIAGAVLVATGGAAGTRTWADVSIIWLIAPLLIFAVLMLVVLSLLIYGLVRLIKVMPRLTGKAQFYTAATASVTHKVADGATKPVIWVQQAGAVIKSIFKL